MRITPHSVRHGFCVFKQEGLWRMKGVLDDLPAQDRLQIDGNTLTEGPLAGGGPNEVIGNAHREMCPDLCSAPDLNSSPKSNVSH